MHFNSEKGPRKKLRLTEYDYRTTGYYYITLCTNHRECLMGEIINGQMHLNAAGLMVTQNFITIPERYFGWTIDSLIVMPNHVHAIFVMEGPARGPAPTRETKSMHNIESSLNSKTTTCQIKSISILSLPELMRNIKSYTTTCYRHGVHQQQWPPFSKCLWQRGYHDHIIRDSNSLDKIREYILNNPMQWELDKNNPMIFNNVSQ